MGSCNFIFFLFYFICLWVKPCNSCNLSPKKTSCLTWRCKHQRIFPFPQQWCTPGWKIRTSDISDLTSKTFCLAEGKYLSVLKPALFQVLEWMMMGAFKRVITQGLCAWSHIQAHPGHTWVLCQLGVLSDQPQTRLWHRGTRSAMKKGTQSRVWLTQMKMFAFILTNQNVVFQ